VACDRKVCKLERYDFEVSACGSLNSGSLGLNPSGCANWLTLNLSKNDFGVIASLHFVDNPVRKNLSYFEQCRAEWELA
jgi:hypothetical protein